MTVEAIHLGEPEGPRLRSVETVRAVAGKGLEGDRRYFYEDGAEPGRALTLVEAENVEAVGLAAGATRRQLTAPGVRLNDLAGKHFRGREGECYCVEPCEPCTHLQSVTRPGLTKELTHP